MKSKLAIVVILFGWAIFAIYVLAEYKVYGSDTLNHFFTLGSSSADIFHRISMLIAPIGASILGYLINERKKFLVKAQQSEKELRHAAQEWRATFDSMPHGVLLTDGEFNVIRINKFTAALAGVPMKKEGYNEKCYKLIHKQDKPPGDYALLKAIKTQKTVRIEFYNKNQNKHFMESVTPVLGERNNVVAYVHVFFDITDTKEKETKLTQVKDAFFNMLKDLDVMYKEQKDIYNNLVIAFSNVIDAKSPWTENHSKSVTAYAVVIAIEMGLREQDIEIIRTAGLLHDIGKIGTYDVILDKPDKLTDEEFTLVKKHPIKGEEILKPIKGLENILPMIRSHHERIDGTGYPDGLKGKKIPFFAKILCVADAYDSMTSERPYRPAPSKDYAISELKRCSGTQFDAEVVKVFLGVLERGEEITD